MPSEISNYGKYKKIRRLYFCFVLFSSYAFADVDASFDLKMVALKNGETRHIKFNIHTGEAWSSKDTVRHQIIDDQKLSPSTYKFYIVNTGLSWRLIRIDTVTGVAWKKNLEGRWVKFTTKK